MDSIDRETQAKHRFMLLNAMRVFAVVLVVMGAAIVGRRWLDLPEYVGFAFIFIGAIEFFWMPIVFKRSWAKQDTDKS
jgi:hypothetical protein